MGCSFEKKLAVGFYLPVNAASDDQGILQGLFHWNVKPEIETGGDEVYREKKQYNRRQQGKCNERNRKTRSKLGTHDLAFAFVQQFDQVAKNQEYEQNKQQQIDVYENKHQNGIGDRDV